MTVTRLNQMLFKMLWHSDQHTLHPHTPTKHILTNIDRMRKKVGIDEIDLEVWGGDLTEGNTDTSDKDFVYLQHWVKHYLHHCHEQGKTVRILAGTHSHEREQPAMFELLKPKGSTLIKYVDTLYLEYMDAFDIHVLYVPDNFGNKPKIEIYNDAVALLSDNGLEQVDFIFLHGMFDFQAPNNLDPEKLNTFDSDAWSELARKAILSGDIHTPGQKGNIYCSGSFDRLRHGEMHPKGGYEVLFNKTSFIAEFVENTHAMTWDTIELLPNGTARNVMDILDDYLDHGVMEGAHIRLKGGDPDIVASVIAEYRVQYPQYRFTMKEEKPKGVTVNDTLYQPTMTNLDTGFSNEEQFTDSLLRHLDGDIPVDIDKGYLAELLSEVLKE